MCCFQLSSAALLTDCLKQGVQHGNMPAEQLLLMSCRISEQMKRRVDVPRDSSSSLEALQIQDVLQGVLLLQSSFTCGVLICKCYMVRDTIFCKTQCVHVRRPCMVHDPALMQYC